MTPLIDVVIPAFNAAATVESAVGSIQSQTERAIRIIVVNDGSVDDTKAIVERMAAADDRIVLLEQPNGGIVDALNLGLGAAAAEFIARHDADDLAVPDRFAKQRAYLAANPDCVAVSGAVWHMDDRARPLGNAYCMPPPELADVERIPQLEPYLSHPFLMMRRSAADRVGGYRHVFHAEDTDLYWRLQESGRLHNMTDLMGHYRMHAGSITGASLVNGRISAVNSQRAGLSAMRRRTGRPDLIFPKSALQDYQAAHSLEEIIRVGSRDLDAEEKKRLAISTCAKLVELAGHRSYELELADCAAIRRLLIPALPLMASKSSAYCNRMLSGTAARLASRGHFAEARLLAPLPLYPAVAAKLALRSMMPLSVRRTIRQAVRGDGFVK